MTYLIKFPNVFAQYLFKQNLPNLVHNIDNTKFTSYNSTFAKLELIGRSGHFYLGRTLSLIPDIQITLKTQSNGKVKYIKY